MGNSRKVTWGRPSTLKVFTPALPTTGATTLLLEWSLCNVLLLSRISVLHGLLLKAKMPSDGRIEVTGADGSLCVS